MECVIRNHAAHLSNAAEDTISVTSPLTSVEIVGLDTFVNLMVIVVNATQSACVTPAPKLDDVYPAKPTRRNKKHMTPFIQ